MDVNKLDYLTDTVVFQFEQQEVRAHKVEGIDFSNYELFLAQTLPDSSSLRAEWSSKGILFRDSNCFFTNHHRLPHNKLPKLFNNNYHNRDINIRWDISSNIFDLGTGEKQLIVVDFSANIINFRTLNLDLKTIQNLVIYTDTIIGRIQNAGLDTDVQIKIHDNHLRFAYIAQSYTGLNFNSGIWTSASSSFQSLDDKVTATHRSLDMIVFNFLWDKKLKQPKLPEIERITQTLNEELI